MTRSTSGNGRRAIIPLVRQLGYAVYTGRELELMLQGLKPLAVFSDLIEADDKILSRYGLSNALEWMGERFSVTPKKRMKISASPSGDFLTFTIRRGIGVQDFNNALLSKIQVLQFR